MAFMQRKFPERHSKKLLLSLKRVKRKMVGLIKSEYSVTNTFSL